MGHVVLIVEDDTDIREDLAELLRDEGYDVEIAANGEEALALLARRREAGALPCVILLDLMMPGMNGWEFRAKQMSVPALACIPVVLLSGFADVEHHARTLHAAAYLIKPIKLDRLFEVVAQNC